MKLHWICTVFLWLNSLFPGYSYVYRHLRLSTANIMAQSTYKRHYPFAVMPIKSADEWDSVMSKATTDRVMIVDFQKSLCKPCKKVAPQFDTLAEKYSDSVSFYKVDADSSKECLALMKHHGIRSVPTFHVYVGSARVDSVRGAHIDLVEDCIIREQTIIAKNMKPAFVDEMADLPPDDDTEKAMSRENPGLVERRLENENE